MQAALRASGNPQGHSSYSYGVFKSWLRNIKVVGTSFRYIFVQAVLGSNLYFLETRLVLLYNRNYTTGKWVKQLAGEESGSLGSDLDFAEN